MPYVCICNYVKYKYTPQSVFPKTLIRIRAKVIRYIDAVEWKGRNWILQTFQYEEKTVLQHYTQIRNIEKGGE